MIGDETEKLSTPTQPHPVVRLRSDRPVSGLMSGFPCQIAFPCMCTVAVWSGVWTRTAGSLNYRCGGSVGFAFDWRHV